MKNLFSRCAPARQLLLGALLLSAAPTFVPVAQAAPAAPTYSSKKDGYAIYLPGKPQSGTRTMAVPGGSMTVAYIVVKTPSVAYIVIPMTLPAAPQGAQASQFLQGVQTGFVMSAGAKLISSKSLTVAGRPAREVLVSVNQGANQSLMRGRFILAGKRSYQIIAVMPKRAQAATRPQVEKVFSSFRLLS